MNKNEKLIAWLKGTSEIEFSNFKSIISYKDALESSCAYLCCGLSEKLDRRCNDNDIANKKYFVVDIDIRMDHYKNTGNIISQDEMFDKGLEIMGLLNDAGYGDYCAFVDSGNGFHIYYSGEERNFDSSVYSAGVKDIYSEIDRIILETGFKCDPAVSNIARITRVPGSINKRKKMKGDTVLRDLGDHRCKVLTYSEEDSKFFKEIEERAERIKIEENKHKEVNKVIARDYKKSDDCWEEINTIPIIDIACDLRGVAKGQENGGNVALKEKHKNMGAYRYKPYNIIVNTGSSLIISDKSYFTTYELVLLEMMGGDKQKTTDFFKDRYGIKFEENKKEFQIPKVEKLKIPEGFVFPGEVFDDLGCIQTGELVTIVAESHSGKTTFALDMIQANSKRGKRGYYINLEFPIRTMRESRRLYINGKRKKNVNDIDPMTRTERDKMNKYIDNKLSQFDYLDHPGGIELDGLVREIVKRAGMGYKLFVVDSFSKISNGASKEYDTQKKIMLKLQEIVQNLQIAIIILHHTNKDGNFAGTQKIFDDSNVFITISKGEDENFESYRTFTLSKDKITEINEINVYFINQKYTSEDQYFQIRKQGF